MTSVDALRQCGCPGSPREVEAVQAWMTRHEFVVPSDLHMAAGVREALGALWAQSVLLLSLYVWQLCVCSRKGFSDLPQHVAEFLLDMSNGKWRPPVCVVSQLVARNVDLLGMESFHAEYFFLFSVAAMQVPQEITELGVILFENTAAKERCASCI